MIYAFDTYYHNDFAFTACIGFSNWESESSEVTITEKLDGHHEYISGEFYKRELPCILNLLKQVDLKEGDVIIVDGFVVLDDDGKHGLGGFLYEVLNGKNPIVGVAKNNFATLNNLKREVLRGESQKPLYITSLGIDLNDAENKIQQMHGPYRMPTLLKELDQLSRSWNK